MAAALALAIVPGEVNSSGDCTRHGWPWIYLTHTDFWAGVLTPKLGAWHVPAFDDSGENCILFETDFRPAVLALDLAASLAILIGATAILERLRRRTNCAIQFSLRTLMVLVLLAACGCAWWLHIDRQCREQQAAAAALSKLWAGVGIYKRPAVPSWLMELTGGATTHRFWHITAVHMGHDGSWCASGMDCTINRNHGGANVLAAFERLQFAQEIKLGYTDFTDQDLRHLSGLQNLEHLSLLATKITDEGLKHLTKLRALQELDVRNTEITDAGLVHLAKLTSLECVYVDGTRVTPEGIRKLRRALPQARIDVHL